MIGGFDTFKNFHKPSSYAKKRYWFIGFPLIGILLTAILAVMYVGDVFHFITTPKRWRRK